MGKRWTVCTDGERLSVNLTPVANLHHKDAQSAVLNVANAPAKAAK
jgi:hypothetical protein